MRKSVIILALLLLPIFMDTVAKSVSLEDALTSATDNHLIYLPITFNNYDIEYTALMLLYYSTDGPNWFDNSGWGVGNPCTHNWYGVLCEGQHIVQIELSGNSLNGVMPGALRNLFGLEILQLDGNSSLIGPIPAELGELSYLRQLILSWNSLDGHIPPELGKMSNLETLDLGSNQLSGPIPPELGNMNNLEELDLGGNQLSGHIPPELGKMSNLERLSLGFNQLSGPIPPELGNLENLGGLNLNNNQLNGSIPAELSKLSNLGYLDLRDNPGLTCWETEEALDWALSIYYCVYIRNSKVCQGGYHGPTEVCRP